MPSVNSRQVATEGRVVIAIEIATSSGIASLKVGTNRQTQHLGPLKKQKAEFEFSDPPKTPEFHKNMENTPSNPRKSREVLKKHKIVYIPTAKKYWEVLLGTTSQKSNLIFLNDDGIYPSDSPRRT